MGIALGAGGMRGVAHIGVLSVLQEAGIPIHLVAGSSIGSIVGGLFASGWKPSDLRDLALKLHPRDVYDSNLRPWPLAKMAAKVILDRLHVSTRWLGAAPMGIVPGRKLLAKLQSWTSNRPVDGLDPAFAAAATVLETGERLLFGPRALHAVADRLEHPARIASEAPLALAARASSAIPGVFEPVAWNGWTLADGGLVDDVPVDVVRALGADVVIAVPLGLAGTGSAVVDDVVEAVDQSIAIMVTSLTREAALHHRADILIEPAVPGVALNNFDTVRGTLAAGEAAARAKLPEIEELLKEHGWTPPAASGG